jgi:cobalt-zinc-cadmium efflux system outer membrane protein
MSRQEMDTRTQRMIGEFMKSASTKRLWIWLGICFWILLGSREGWAQSGAASANGDTIQVASVEQLQQLVAEHNPALKSDFLAYQAALERVPQQRQLPDPEVAFGYFIQPIETRVGPQQARVSLSQMLPWFGKRDSKASVSELKAKAQYQAFMGTRNRLFLKAEQLWYNWYELETSVRLLREHIRILDSFEQLALRQYEVDKGGQIDVLRVQMQRDDTQTRLEDLQDQRNTLREQLRSLTRSVPVNLQIADSLQAIDQELSYEELMTEVEQSHPMLARIEEQRSAADQAIQTARLNGMPDIGVGLDYIFTGERSMSLTDNGKDAVLAKASIKIPLYRKGYDAQVKEAQLSERSLEEQWQWQRDQLAVKAERSLRQFRDAQRKIKLYRQGQLQRNQQALDILIEQYSADGSEFEEILRLESQKLDYKLALERALVAQHLADATIRYLSNAYPEPTPEQP